MAPVLRWSKPLRPALVSTARSDSWIFIQRYKGGSSAVAGQHCTRALQSVFAEAWPSPWNYPEAVSAPYALGSPGAFPGARSTSFLHTAHGDGLAARSIGRCSLPRVYIGAENKSNSSGRAHKGKGFGEAEMPR